jgi:hypothetical protein
MFKASPEEANADEEEFSEEVPETAAAVTASEDSEAAPKESGKIMDGQLDSSKDENDKKALGSIWNAPSESKSNDDVKKSESDESAEEPKESKL